MIDYVKPGDVLGQNLMFDDSRFDVSAWDYFKRWFDNQVYSFQYDRPTAFSRDFINSAFKPIVNIVTGMIVRDQEFQFVAHFKQSDWLGIKYDYEHDHWVAFINFNKECTD